MDTLNPFWLLVTTDGQWQTASLGFPLGCPQRESRYVALYHLSFITCFVQFSNTVTVLDC